MPGSRVSIWGTMTEAERDEPSNCWAKKTRSYIARRAVGDCSFILPALSEFCDQINRVCDTNASVGIWKSVIARIGRMRTSDSIRIPIRDSRFGQRIEHALEAEIPHDWACGVASA